MRISREEVLKIARLARLSLSEAETDAMTRQLDAILEYAGKLNELDTTGVEPTAHVGERATPMREDVPGPSLAQEAATANAPKSVGGAFIVPKTVDVG